MSDCDADADVYRAHHYYKTAEETVAGVLKAGTDVDCTSFVGQNAKAALDAKLIDEAEIDKHLKVNKPRPIPAPSPPSPIAP